MKYILYITGYSRSGKSTLLTCLKQRGVQVISSSDYLTDETLMKFNEYSPYNAQLMKDKDPEFDRYFQLVHGKSLRDAKIFMAEEVLVPMHGTINGVFHEEIGRLNGLVMPAIKDQYCEEKGNFIAIECFNRIEWSCWKKAFQVMFPADHASVSVAIRRETELQGVDNRELVGIEVWNNNTPAYLCDKMLNVFNVMTATEWYLS